MPDAASAGFRILAIDGGGIKGVFAASFLAELETTLGEPLVDHFDLISGTSTGGIIALGLGMGLSAAEILSFYETHGPKIFSKGHLGFLRQWTSAKYSSEPLKMALEEVFGARLLGDSKTRLLIPSLNLETGEVHVFKTAHHERFIRDYKEKVVDVALATAAAPTFFPAHNLESGTPLIDGGVWANNPMGTAAVEALGVLEWPKGSIKLLGVGCTTAVPSATGGRAHGRGKLYWATRVADTFMAGQSSASLGTAQLLLGRENVHRVSPVVGASMYKLDGVAGIKSLRGLGASQARTEYPKVKEMFLTGKAEKFLPKGGRQ